MSLRSFESMIWTNDQWMGTTRSFQSPSSSRESSLEDTTLSAKSDFAFNIGPDQISVSTIVEKLVTERLKLGIVKTAKQEPIIHISMASSEKGSTESSEETIPSLTICLDKFDKRVVKMQQEMNLDGIEPDDQPFNVIEPNFSEPEDEIDDKHRNPNKDLHMMLNRTRSLYTPAGFKDSRFDLKRLETDRERMWTQSGRDKYTILLYEEAVRHLRHIKIKGQIYDDDDSDTFLSREDAVAKSLESIMGVVKPKELPPEEWDPDHFLTMKYPPYWAMALPHATNKTINKIRYIYKILKGTDFHRQDPKMRRKTGRRLHKLSEEVEESEETATSSSEEESSEDEPYLLKRRDSSFIKKKVQEIIVEEEEEQCLEIRSGQHNIQVGHEISISTLQKIYQESPEETESESDSGEDMSQHDTHTSLMQEMDEDQRDTTLTAATSAMFKKRPPKSSWIKKDELDELTSEESLYDIKEFEEEGSHHKEIKVPAKPYITMHRGFPRIRQRPKWITLARECLEKEDEDNSLVERYRCLCLNRGIPPLECVARNIKKQSAIFNRMGRGPEDTIETLTEVLGPQTKTLDLTGVYMSKNDICHLCKALPRFEHLTKLRLSRTQLTGEKFFTLIKSINNSEALCLLDVSYNNLRRISPAMTKALRSIMTLSSLNLKHCQLGNDSFAGLAYVAGSLTSLDISWNKLNEPAGLKALLAAFIKNKSQLRELRMGWNSIAGLESSKILADIGKNLMDLVFYDISYNGFNAAEEVVPFNSMLLECVKLKCLLLGGNPLGVGSAEALLKDLQWSGKPALRLLDLGDFWVDKDTYQVCKTFKEQYGVEIKIGGVKGNINLFELDMSVPYLKRLNFINTSKKKKKTLKDLGNAVMKLMTREEVKRVKAGRFKTLLTDEKFKLEEGLADALAKSLSDKSRMIDLQAVYDKYRALYPEEVKDQKKKPKKKKVMKEEIPIVEIMEHRVDSIRSRTNLLFVKATEALATSK